MISILLPNLNNRPFLEERIESIYRQTISDWELIVVDGYSEDGAWEFFKGLASRDGRVKVSQAPRQGIYAGWNECIRRSTGRYVYFATSDDTMAADCLEKLSGALDQYPGCGLAHCGLRLFDEYSQEIPKDWWRQGLFVQSSGDFVYRRHIRKAPFDGLLHLLGQMVYISITQLMIRRDLFSSIGLFPINRGSIGDFQWVMKATLMNDSIHLPDTWGGWRQHHGQATAHLVKNSPGHWRAHEEMSRYALAAAEDFIGEPARSFIRSPAALSHIQKNRLRAELADRAGRFDRFKYIASQTRNDPGLVVALMLDKIKSKIGLRRIKLAADWVQFLKEHGVEPTLVAIDKARG